MRWIRRIQRRTERGSSSNENSHQGRVRSEPGRIAAGIPADNPIRSPDHDLLGRSTAARSFAEQVLQTDVSEGVVVGVLGPWGSGKTSFVNLARSRWDDLGATVLEFNPWMFSGTEQLVNSFFVELSAQLKLRADFSKVAKGLAEYGEAFSGLGWLPLVGTWIERARLASGVLRKMLKRQKEGIGARRNKVTRALSALHKPIIIVLDDIDRLTKTEIRHVFRLVRLIANFPNVVYVVAFDRRRVEIALSEHDSTGRDYLEKILQVAVDLPAVPESVLRKQLLRAIEDAISDIDDLGPFDEDVWGDIFSEIILPLIRNMRDVRRYAISVRAAAKELGGQIALTDVLGLEAVRVFLPDTFGQLHKCVDALTQTSHWGGDDPKNTSHFKEQIDRLIETADDREEVVRALVKRLFPAGQRHISLSPCGSEYEKTWGRTRRVAHKNFLRFYLERVVSKGLQVLSDAEHSWTLMADQRALDNYLRSLDQERLRDVISSLEAYAEDFGPEHVEPTTVVLFNLLPELPRHPTGLFDFGGRTDVRSVVHRLFRPLTNTGKAEEAIRNILPQISTLSSKLELVSLIGHREGTGHRHVSESAAIQFETDLCYEIGSAPIEVLAQETDLLKLLLFTKLAAGRKDPPITIDSSPNFTLALLKSALTEVRSQSVGTRRLRRSPRLAWDALVSLYGDEGILSDRIASLKRSRLNGHDALLALAEKYAGGWRPELAVED
ncbi:MAG: P-loop NTPase fold protein [Bryobacterales bacterium]|nr:P-loop NTPase fold protein [Bryobacterales bacterium]